MPNIKRTRISQLFFGNHYYTAHYMAQCIVIGPVCLCVDVFVCGLLPRLLEIACIDLHQIGSVGEGSDHLQRIKFCLSCATGKGVCGGAKIFGSSLLVSVACSV